MKDGEVLPSIKVDADSRNIEELHIEKDPERYSQELADKKAALIEKGPGIQRLRRNDVRYGGGVSHYR